MREAQILFRVFLGLALLFFSLFLLVALDVYNFISAQQASRRVFFGGLWSALTEFCLLGAIAMHFEAKEKNE